MKGPAAVTYVPAGGKGAWEMKQEKRQRVAGAAAGLVNGLFGGGGGTVLLPVLTRELEGRKAFAVCVAAMLPMCAVSAAAGVLSAPPELWQAAPCLAGGLLGGVLGGLTFGKVPVGVLRKAAGLFMVYGGVRYLL